MVRGTPKVAKRLRSREMIEGVSARGRMWTSNHLDIWSTVTMRMHPETGPARSTLSCDQGMSGHGEGTQEVAGGRLAH